MKLSQELWGINWEKHFPKELANSSIIMNISNFSEFISFVQNHLLEMFPDSSSSNFLHSESGPAKEIYYNKCVDIFSFKDGDKIVGVFIGNPIDWSSYYMRFTYVQPDYRGKNIFSHCSDYMTKILSHFPIDRIEAEISPSNLGQIKRIHNLGFNITGMRLSERWGGLNIMTKFLNIKHKKVFLNQFCQGAKPQLQSSKS